MNTDILAKYLEKCVCLAESEESSAKDTELLMHVAFGAVEMFTEMNPHLAEEVRKSWNEEWEPTFKTLIQETSLRGSYPSYI